MSCKFHEHFFFFSRCELNHLILETIFDIKTDTGASTSSFPPVSKRLNNTSVIAKTSVLAQPAGGCDDQRDVGPSKQDPDGQRCEQIPSTPLQRPGFGPLLCPESARGLGMSE